jgi:inner membrane protease subunit 2
VGYGWTRAIGHVINNLCYNKINYILPCRGDKCDFTPVNMWRSIQWRHWGKRAAEWCGVVGVAWWLSENVFTIVRVEGASMWPTLNPEVHSVPWGDILLVWRWSYQPRVGDVVCAYSPHTPHRQIVKRIVALGPAIVWPYTRLSSPTVESSQASTFGARDVTATEVRAVVSPPSPYLGVQERVDDEIAVHVPAGYVWLEGDHHWESLDSNDYGPLPVGLITGKATRILLPHAHFWQRVWQPIPTSLPIGHSRVQQQRQEQLPSMLSSPPNK